MSLSIVALAEAHVPSILDACRDWRELAQYGPPYWRPRSSAQLHRKIAATAGPQLASEYDFVIINNDHLIGECSIHTIDWRNRHGEVGICIWNPSDRNKGYGSSAVKHVIQWAQEDLDLHRLEAWILEGNTASETLFARLGFTCEGKLRNRYLHNSIHKDVNIYGLLLTDT